MTFSTAYSYKERTVFDIKTFIEALRFLIVNAILALIFLFLTLEAVEWSIFSFRERLTDRIIDNTTWNINTIF